MLSLYTLLLLLSFYTLLNGELTNVTEAESNGKSEASIALQEAMTTKHELKTNRWIVERKNRQKNIGCHTKDNQMLRFNETYTSKSAVWQCIKRNHRSFLVPTACIYNTTVLNMGDKKSFDSYVYQCNARPSGGIGLDIIGCSKSSRKFVRFGHRFTKGNSVFLCKKSKNKVKIVHVQCISQDGIAYDIGKSWSHDFRFYECLNRSHRTHSDTYQPVACADVHGDRVDVGERIVSSNAIFECIKKDDNFILEPVGDWQSNALEAASSLCTVDNCTLSTNECSTELCQSDTQEHKATTKAPTFEDSNGDTASPNEQVTPSDECVMKDNASIFEHCQQHTSMSTAILQETISGDGNCTSNDDDKYCETESLYDQNSTVDASLHLDRNENELETDLHLSNLTGQDVEYADLTENSNNTVEIVGCIIKGGEQVKFGETFKYRDGLYICNEHGSRIQPLSCIFDDKVIQVNETYGNGSLLYRCNELSTGGIGMEVISCRDETGAIVPFRKRFAVKNMMFMCERAGDKVKIICKGCIGPKGKVYGIKHSWEHDRHYYECRYSGPLKIACSDDEGTRLEPGEMGIQGNTIFDCVGYGDKMTTKIAGCFEIDRLTGNFNVYAINQSWYLPVKDNIGHIMKCRDMGEKAIICPTACFYNTGAELLSLKPGCIAQMDQYVIKCTDVGDGCGLVSSTKKSKLLPLVAYAKHAGLKQSKFGMETCSFNVVE